MSASDIEKKGGSLYSQASNADNIDKLLAAGSRSVSVRQ